MSEHGASAVPDLSAAAWLADPVLTKVLGALSASGASVRIAGGAVRDALMRRAVTDVDLAIDAPPDDVTALARAAGFKVVPTGLDHGTVTVVAGEGGAARSFEVTTLRVDVENFGRHARVAFGTDWEADARRRDFTINALYCDGDGTVFDPLGGYGDIQARRVRFVGEPAARIAEDYLRILRFFRFHGELGRGEPDQAGLAACIENRDGLARLSAERIRNELLRLLVSDRGPETLSVMIDAGILDQVLDAELLAGRLERYFAIVADSGDQRDPLLALISVLAGPARDGARIAARLRLANREQARLRCAVALSGDWNAPPPDQALRAAIYRDGASCVADGLIASWVMSSAPPGNGDWANAVNYARTWQPSKFPLSGRDVRALGLPQGPAIGEILQDLENRWLEGDFDAGEPELRDWLRAAVASGE